MKLKLRIILEYLSAFLVIVLLLLAIASVVAATHGAIQRTETIPIIVISLLICQACRKRNRISQFHPQLGEK